MNAGLITEDVMSILQKRFGKPVQISKGQVYTFGSSVTFSINYSKNLRGDKFFYALPSAMVDPAAVFPPAELGAFALFICGSADRLLVVPRSIMCEMLQGVPSRRVDIFNEGDSLIMQTTKHPKLNVTEYLNTFPSVKKPIHADSDDTASNAKIDRLHVIMQWSLIRLGHAEGCSVWVPINDRNLSFRGTPFTGLTLAKLPNFGFEENTRRIVQNIDVLWLKKNVIRKAFEIEATTSIYSGLLRLNDLVLSQPNNQIGLYIAASESRRTHVFNQLIRPSFQNLLPVCKFLAFDEIENQAKHLESMDLSRGVRVSGLIKGDLFQIPENLVYPADL